MHERVRVTFCFYADGLHKPAAGLRAVARVHIYMLAPEAMGAMIRVARAAHFRAAFLADEVFYRAREAHCF